MPPENACDVWTRASHNRERGNAPGHDASWPGNKRLLRGDVSLSGIPLAKGGNRGQVLPRAPFELGF